MSEAINDNQAQQDMTTLIEHMKVLGWVEHDAGWVYHSEVDREFPNWVEAIKACIEVGSGYD